MIDKFTLRKLERKDAPLMFEWMHDDSVTHYLQSDFSAKTIEDCLSFINASVDDKRNIHLAIVDSYDEYMGTVSLKNITDNNAEFAITIRKEAMGTGCSAISMRKIINIALKEMNLKEVYWCVSPANKRAIKFYDKNRYERVSFDNLTVNGSERYFSYNEKQIEEYIWYHIVR